MRIDILTLFPEMIKPFIDSSIIARALKENKVQINIINFRDFSLLNNKQVDDTPYGGGAGMVLMCEPIYRAIESVRTKDSKVILLTPSAQLYNQKTAYALSKEKHLIIVSGHYEGFDERIKDYCDMSLSIGEYVLTGGELPASVIVDSIVRLLPNVINEESLESESFTDDLFDYPVYTKPRVFNGVSVPEVYLSGDHKKIEEARKASRNSCN
ncbi:MAG: tRNA (guanosine(37)-N1)-methyltransferase TrmD [Bacilli bacterium]